MEKCKAIDAAFETGPESDRQTCTEQFAPYLPAAAVKIEKTAQVATLVRRITGRVRLYARVFELVPAKK